MNIATLLPFILIIGVMLLMTRSAKNKQRQAAEMRNQMQPGTGVRTIGGMIAKVKEVRDTTVLLEVAPGVHSLYAKNAVGAVLSDEEYDSLVNNDIPLTFDEHPGVDGTPVVEPADEPEHAAKSQDEEPVNLDKAAATDGEATDAKDAVRDADTAKDAKDSEK
ncbi:preprotein translocase subunit YajC [Streptomyces silvisoli]|uniref:Preprotein translocase subunit YajC n=1 Tax=Streptomyces silvisoli TaxID=3034235 RepID=A0ABT5ZGE9_9ACTN|nr:preprotein translocase subunit YajC [Streptomyces silvisoli]MDF3288901.1 preprotein translocase subunit YajC [Streptomyces silvisoli]